MVSTHLKEIALSSSASIMQMRDCSSTSIVIYSNWSRRNTSRVELIGQKLNLKTTKLVLIFLKSINATCDRDLKRRIIKDTNILLSSCLKLQWGRMNYCKHRMN
ncbi:hypothetical protein SOVF_105820 isoform B [Spinacia oleracea]|nr:hypothetical protein SOVF_105820 isoform B [Spinacia oleracea]